MTMTLRFNESDNWKLIYCTGYPEIVMRTTCMSDEKVVKVCSSVMRVIGELVWTIESILGTGNWSSGSARNKKTEAIIKC